jgi:hypothetical protein
MMSTCCSKHVEAWNKYIKKVCVKLVINQNYVKMLYGQQNIKFGVYSNCDSAVTWFYIVHKPTWNCIWLDTTKAVVRIYGPACQCVTAKCVKGTHDDAGASVVPQVRRFDLQIYLTDFEEIWYSLVLIICYMLGEETRQSGVKGKRGCGSVLVFNV